MDIRSDLKELSTVERELSVVIPGDQVAKELDRAYRKLSQKVRIKGFRQGKVPRYVLEQYYKEQTEQDVLEAIVGKSYASAVDDHALSPVAPPQIKAAAELIPGMDFQYSARVEVKPVIELAKSEGLDVVKHIYKVDDSSVNGQLERMQDQMVKVVPIEDRDVVQQGDLCEINWSGTIDGEPVKGLRGVSFVVEVGAQRFFNEVEQALVGKKIGDSFSVDVAVPDDHRLEAARGKTAKLTIVPNELKSKIKPALDDDFAQDVGEEYETLEQLKASISEDIGRAAKSRSENELKEAVLAKLVEANPFEVPGALIERQAEEMAATQLQRLPREQAERIWMANRQQMMEEARPRAVQQVRAGLLLETIVNAQGIEISEEDVDAHLEKMAADMGQDLKMVRNLYKKGDRRRDLTQHLAAERAIEYLVSKANVTEEEKTF